MGAVVMATIRIRIRTRVIIIIVTMTSSMTSVGVGVRRVRVRVRVRSNTRQGVSSAPQHNTTSPPFFKVNGDDDDDDDDDEEEEKDGVGAMHLDWPYRRLLLHFPFVLPLPLYLFEGCVWQTPRYFPREGLAQAWWRHV